MSVCCRRSYAMAMRFAIIHSYGEPPIHSLKRRLKVLNDRQQRSASSCIDVLFMTAYCSAAEKRSTSRLSTTFRWPSHRGVRRITTSTSLSLIGALSSQPSSLTNVATTGLTSVVTIISISNLLCTLLQYKSIINIWIIQDKHYFHIHFEPFKISLCAYDYRRGPLVSRS